MDNIIEKTVSNLIETQFPEFYLTDGPTFVLFVKKYYEWLEGKSYIAKAFPKGTVSFSSKNSKITGLNTFFTTQFEVGDKIALYVDDTEFLYEYFDITSIESDTVLYIDGAKLNYSSNKSLYGAVELKENVNWHSRRIKEYDDVDKTTDEFIVFFKEKYLKNLQFTTKTDTRQLIKHSLDLYRSKGTPRGIDLMFKLIFGTGAKVYYPGEDVFRTSNAKWFVPKYLELSLKEKSVLLVNKQIVGLLSGATAFVDSIIRRTVNGKMIDIAYISAISGEFITGEIINSSDKILLSEECPVITGSLTTLNLDINGTAENYKIGDIVDVYSANGAQGKARVTSVSDITGIINYQFLEGGYAYSNNHEVLVSEKILQINNVVSNSNYYFDAFQTITQPLANISYSNANGVFSNSEFLYAYYSNGSLSGNAYILSTSTINATHGTLLVDYISGNLNTSYIGTSSNSVIANISSSTFVNATANVIGYSDTITLKTKNTFSNNFQIGDVIYQTNLATLRESAIGTINTYVQDFGSNSFITVSNTYGVFDLNKPLYNKQSTATGNVLNVILNVGVKDITNEFFAMVGNRITSPTTTGNIQIISTGSGASLTISNTYNYTENVSINTDFILPYVSVALNAVSYGLAANSSANLGTVIKDGLGYSNLQFGKLVRIQSYNVGSEYNLPPIIKVFDSYSYPYNKKDVFLEIDNLSTNFEIGEVVYQQANESRGLVINANNTVIHVQDLRTLPEKNFQLTTNSTTILVGENSGATANINYFYQDEYSFINGLNSLIETSTKTGTGSVTGLAVQGSGFGFVDNEQVNFKSTNNISEGTAFAKLGKYGKAPGFFKNKEGFLSSNKRLFDGTYYQDYSYEIRSSITLDKYEEMLKKLMHIPGTKYFGALVYKSINEQTVSAKSTQITVS